ncbi:MAG: cell division protein FtsH, partial [SAR202 cluster bacterium]|nr:cell division protein FtsH [SAR202 cluster bacterium]
MNRQPAKNPKTMRNMLVYLVISVAIIAIIWALFRTPGGSTDLAFSEVLDMAKAEKISTIEVRGDDLVVKSIDGRTTYRSRKESGASLYEILGTAGVKTGAGGVRVSVKGSSGFNFFGILINFLPLIIFGGLLLFMMRQAQGTGSQAM